ncbi:MAG: hypothetical protein AAF922_14310 [Pseudomonadota bacterium]
MSIKSIKNSFFSRFIRDESGAITVDYVVLSAAVTYLGISGVGALQDATNNFAVALSGGVSAPAIVGEE